MQQDDYGEHYHEHLLEQYKLYVEMTDNISDRRDRSNAFYLTLLSGLLVVVSAIAAIWGADSPLAALMAIGIGVVGVLLCAVWFINIRSYRQLNTGRFAVIHRMEQELPFACYDEEWEVLGRGKDKSKYWPFTHVEKWVPVIMGVPYGLLIVCGVVKLALWVIGVAIPSI
ncbi:MAG: hypothetical protein PHQ43_03580 [Dehalococcoidales bacterium]|nr:hypothetical protein [Dehalococcoidales bacterium]